MMTTKYPCVPGHELAGVVTRVGSKVTKCAVGDRVGVGCIVDTCMDCSSCQVSDEHLCQKVIMTMMMVAMIMCPL